MDCVLCADKWVMVGEVDFMMEEVNRVPEQLGNVVENVDHVLIDVGPSGKLSIHSPFSVKTGSWRVWEVQSHQRLVRCAQYWRHLWRGASLRVFSLLMVAP